MLLRGPRRERPTTRVRRSRVGVRGSRPKAVSEQTADAEYLDVNSSIYEKARKIAQFAVQYLRYCNGQPRSRCLRKTDHRTPWRALPPGRQRRESVSWYQYEMQMG